MAVSDKVSVRIPPELLTQMDAASGSRTDIMVAALRSYLDPSAAIFAESTDEALSAAIARAELAERKLASLAEPSSVVPLRRPPSKSRPAETGVIPALGDEARRTAVSKLNLPVYDPGRNLILDPVNPKKGK